MNFYKLLTLGMVLAVLGTATASPAQAPQKQADPAAALRREMSQACRIGARKQYDLPSQRITFTGPIKKQGDGSYALNGIADQGKHGKKKFSCRFDKNNKLTEVWALTSDGE